jgi:hypothetical protein
MLKRPYSIFAWFCLLALSGCHSISKPNSDAKPVQHQEWDSLLKAHVKDNGLVDYKGFIADSQRLNAYLTKLSNHHPNDENWSRNQQLAYWINAYNAYTVKLILKHYPVKSIKDIVNGPNIPFVNSPWDINFIDIEGREYDLNNLEHGIIREQFKEPRIHFAVNCASISCPVLRPEAYTADKLNQQLNEQARLFIQNPAKNQLEKNQVRISKIFRWYSGDFKKEGRSMIDYLNKYCNETISEDASIDYMDYNWKLNAVHQMEAQK